MDSSLCDVIMYICFSIIEWRYFLSTPGTYNFLHLQFLPVDVEPQIRLSIPVNPTERNKSRNGFDSSL